MEGSAILIVFATVVLLPLVWLIANFNRFVRVRQQIQESWADIEVELKRRYELIPNLVETVRGYAKHERDVLELVVQLRNKAMANHGAAGEQAVDESALQVGVKRLFAIAAARRFFNGNVREMNQLCGLFPTNLIASSFGFEPATYFELSNEAERVVPRVDLSPQATAH